MIGSTRPWRWRVMAGVASLPATEKYHELAQHVWLFLQRMMNPGRGADWLEDRYFPTKNAPGNSDLSWMASARDSIRKSSRWRMDRSGSRGTGAKGGGGQAFAAAPVPCDRALRRRCGILLERDLHRAGCGAGICDLPDGPSGGEPRARDCPLVSDDLGRFNRPGEYPQLGFMCPKRIMTLGISTKKARTNLPMCWRNGFRNWRA